MTPRETMVRMGELAISVSADEVLVTIGLGSCIGIAVVDAHGFAAALAHVMLPNAPTGQRGPKFADTAVEELVVRVEELGIPRTRLVAAIVGGAQMFNLSAGSLQIGARNEAAVREALEAVGVPVAAAATGGDKGRTIRVHVGSGLVTSREAGGSETTLVEPAVTR